MPLRIDAHQHFWNLDLAREAGFDYCWMDSEPLAPIRRNYLPADLAPLLAAAGVDRTVFVQTQHRLEENRWVLSLAEPCEFIAGVVGWVDLASEACEEQLLEFAEQPKFVGVRHVTHDEPDPDFIVRDDVLRGLKVLEKHRVPFDLLFFVEHLPHADRLGRELPELPLVIDHLAKPHIKAGRMDNWLEPLRAAARHENIYCKLSGLITEADWRAWRPSDLRPYVETALELFGPARCMFGSDWPVCELAGSYQQVHDALAESIADLSESEQAQIYGGTATEFYRLPPSPACDPLTSNP